MIYALPKPGERVKEFDYAPAFQIFLAVFGFIFVVFTVFHTWTRTGSQLPLETTLFAIIFLLLSISFMRLIRHDELVLKQFRFKLMNATSLIGVMIGAVILSNQRLLSFILTATLTTLGFIWSYLLEPVLEFILRILFSIFAFFLNLFGLGGEVEMDFLSPEAPQGGGADYSDWAGPVEANVIFQRVIIILAIVIVILLVVKLFQMLGAKVTPPEARDDGVEEERFSLDDQKRRFDRKRHFGRYKENQIREIYREFLVLLKKKKVDIPLYLTSAEVENRVDDKFKAEKSSILRETYIRIRYGEISYTKEDVKRIKGLYKEIKEEIERF